MGAMRALARSSPPPPPRRAGRHSRPPPFPVLPPLSDTFRDTQSSSSCGRRTGRGGNAARAVGGSGRRVPRRGRRWIRPKCAARRTRTTRAWRASACWSQARPRARLCGLRARARWGRRGRPGAGLIWADAHGDLGRHELVCPGAKGRLRPAAGKAIWCYFILQA